MHLVIGARTITGLLGRNGAGKTTLLRILAGQEFPSSGSVQVFGSAPAENENVLRRLVLVREDQAYPDFRGYPDFKVVLCASCRVLLLSELGRGPGVLAAEGLRPAGGQGDQEPVARAAVGPRDHASGSPPAPRLTLFDAAVRLDSHAGSRGRSSMTGCWRTDAGLPPQRVLLSTHLIDEAAALFENVVVIDRGRVVLDTAADGAAWAWPPTVEQARSSPVNSFTEGRPVWERRGLGSRGVGGHTGGRLPVRYWCP